MKRWLAALLAAVLLSGCAEAVPEHTEQPASPTVTAGTTAPEPGLYDKDHPITNQTGGAVLAYPLDEKVHGMYLQGEKILLSSVCEEGLQLTLLAGSDCVPEAQTILTGIDAEHTLWTGEEKAACYDAATNCLILLDGRLKIFERIPVPQGITSAAMDSGLSSLYYSMEDKLCVLDTETGISRMLRQSQGHTFCITGLAQDTLLQCRVAGEDGSQQTELISCADGQVSYGGTALEHVEVAADSWLATWTDGPVTQWLFGSGEEIQVFVPAQAGTVQLLKDGNILSLSGPEDAAQVLEYYPMDTRSRAASVTLQNIVSTAFHAAGDTGIWFVATDSAGGEILCCWQPEKSAAEPAQCLFPRYTRENPDRSGLEACAAYARQIGEKYGITVSLEAPEALLQNYRFETEYHADAIYAALEAVENGLSQFPEDFYERVVRVTNARSFQISLVRSITGVRGEAVPDEKGLQAWHDGDAYIAVAVGADTLSQLYHQLWHMTETYVFSRNSVLDTWDWLNPEGFAYLETYADAQFPEQWLSGPEMAFLNTHAMTFAREDRATVMEYAMAPGNEGLFESDIMQQKLNSLCWSIRRAFRWTEVETVFPWEQYLNQPPYGNSL